MAAKRSESEGSINGGGRRGQQQRQLRLRCNFVATGSVGCSKGATAIGGRWGNDVHDCYGGGQQRYEVRDGCCCVQFIASCDQDSWQRTIIVDCDVNRLKRKIVAGSFLPQGLLLAAIKEDGSKSAVGSIGQRKMHAAVEGIREIGQLKGWWTEGFNFWVRSVAVLGTIWGYSFVEFRLRIDIVLGL
ncbi:hypothetical protein BHM03_00057308 [Ensete ventricosum]|nr:hypothetical protein BHM03_00057308 [Ensete ventricosum]